MVFLPEKACGLSTKVFGPPPAACLTTLSIEEFNPSKASFPLLSWSLVGVQFVDMLRSKGQSCSRAGTSRCKVGRLSRSSDVECSMDCSCYTNSRLSNIRPYKKLFLGVLNHQQ